MQEPANSASTKSKTPQIMVIILMVVLIAAFFAFDLGQYLTLDYLKGQESRFRTYYQENTLATILAYFAVYVAVTGLSLPGATILTLAGGAMFGVGVGTLVVSFASTVGATCAFLAARFILRDWVQGRFGSKLTDLNEGMQREGAFYLFSLRLVPLFPFFVINLAMGLTTLRTWQFYLVSQLGMLPGTLVYVNAGTQIARITSLKDVASPQLIASFAALGIFPIVAKKIIGMLKKKASH